MNGTEYQLAELHVTTAEGQPSPPEQFRLVGSAFASAFQVTWSPPTHLRGILQDYLLTIIPECKTRAAECSNGSNTVQESTVAPLDCDPRNVTKMVLAANVTEYLFVDGMPATAYRVTVSARNTAALGEPAVMGVETKARPPTRAPSIVRVRQTITSTVMVEFDFPCPYSGTAKALAPKIAL